MIHDRLRTELAVIGRATGEFASVKEPLSGAIPSFDNGGREDF